MPSYAVNPADADANVARTTDDESHILYDHEDLNVINCFEENDVYEPSWEDQANAASTNRASREIWSRLGRRSEGWFCAGVPGLGQCF